MHLRELFAAGPRRGEQFVAEGVGLSLDASKHRITAERIRLLLAPADGCDLRDGIEAILAADHPVLADRDDAELAMRIRPIARASDLAAPSIHLHNA